ncbi:MAG TPA: TetR/AcrR family transcriptional regulator [Mucilaginibacter sp.]|nr:TetR/AcrR family transcriptional regulator [Mucilaginibacter sp.]
MARTKDFDEDEVLEKAMHLFWLNGYNATSMQDLVDGLGISRSSLYDTYGDKHTLFLRALENYKQSVSAKMERIVSHTPSARETVRQLLELTTRELITDNEHKGCFLVNAAVEVAPHDAEVSLMICQGDRQLEEFFREAIKKGQQSGEIVNPQDAAVLARFILNNIKGFRVTAKSVTDKKFFADLVNLTMSVLD